ncbi:MAG: DNA polymerase IV, partial [Spirochaetota bacterium]
LRGYLGESTGSYLYRACRGIDPGIFGSRSTKHSISTETTFSNDISDRHALETVLLELCEQVMYRVYKSRSYGYTVTTKLRTDDFRTYSRQKTLGRKIESVDDLYAVSRVLLSDMAAGKPVRLIGVGIVTDSGDADREQPELFDLDVASDHKKRTVEAAVWSMREKLGVDVHKARVLPPPRSHGEKT